ncbi:PAAR domain-containing protein [Psychrobacter sp. ENNN9_III]|uniref:PAAR domain-containing protein n=1 Tax=Psychrobacter sp. ENNN9_III TaxID=1254334 RepID=UPI000A51E392|nr:PAAR domain-containing protein [Psychrobacter sp. ENNN9_III]
MAAYITVGAKTTHGGEVITGSPYTTHNGVQVSRKGDKVICKKCKKVTTILTGDPSFIVDGAPIARGGDITSCGAKLIAIQHSFAESDFEVFGVEQPEPKFEQPAPLKFPKSDPEAVLASFAASKDEQPPAELGILFVSFTPLYDDSDTAEGSLIAGNTFFGEPNEGGGGDAPVYIPGTAGTPEELRYQAELEALYIDIDGDETKFRQGVKDIAARDMLAFDILTIPAGLGVKSAQIGVKAGQYVIKSKAKSINKAKIKNNNQIDDDLGNKPLGRQEYDPNLIKIQKETSTKIAQSQRKHIKGDSQHKHGSYFNSTQEAQEVLDAFHSNKATIVGYNRQNQPIVRYDGISGVYSTTNKNRVTYTAPTNYFIIKGTKKVSVVPTSPKGPKN